MSSQRYVLGDSLTGYRSNSEVTSSNRFDQGLEYRVSSAYPDITPPWCIGPYFGHFREILLKQAHNKTVKDFTKGGRCMYTSYNNLRRLLTGAM